MFTYRLDAATLPYKGVCDAWGILVNTLADMWDSRLGNVITFIPPSGSVLTMPVL